MMYIFNFQKSFKKMGIHRQSYHQYNIVGAQNRQNEHKSSNLASMIISNMFTWALLTRPTLVDAE